MEEDEYDYDYLDEILELSRRNIHKIDFIWATVMCLFFMAATGIGVSAILFEGYATGLVPTVIGSLVSIYMGKLALGSLRKWRGWSDD